LKQLVLHFRGVGQKYQKLNLSTGIEIKTKATIDFEIGIPPASLDTPDVINTIDSRAPTSQVLPLATTQDFTSFDLPSSIENKGRQVSNLSLSAFKEQVRLSAKYSVA